MRADQIQLLDAVGEDLRTYAGNLRDLGELDKLDRLAVAEILQELRDDLDAVIEEVRRG